MGAGINSISILLVYLLLLMQLIALGIGARETITHQNDHDEEHNILLVQGRHNSMHVDHHTHDHAHAHSSSAQMEHMQALAMGLFLINDLNLGKKLLLDFPMKLLSSSSRFLPKEEADLIPFSLKEFPNLLQVFSISHGSPKAKSIEETLRHCDFEPVKGKIAFCATSLESMIDMTGTALGTDYFTAITTNYLTKSLTRKQNYTISQVPEEVSVPKMMVVCHIMSYPYAVFYCHGLETEHGYTLFKVSVVGDNGDRVKVVGICHMETSTWNPNYLPFRLLGVKPGNPLCHFLSPTNLVWVPSTTAE